MAPPKRKTGGRVTPAKSASTISARPTDQARPAPVQATSRTTARRSDETKESPPWWPWLLLSLLVAGGASIIVKNLAFPDNNWLMLAGMAFILVALYLATMWR